jgi:hypothetical protein
MYPFFLLTCARSAHLTFVAARSLKGNAQRAHLGPTTGKRKRTGPRQKTLQRREALVESSASHSGNPTLATTVFDSAPAQRWNQGQHMADIRRVCLCCCVNFLSSLLTGGFTGTINCEKISLPDEGNKEKDCSRKGERDIGPSSGMYSVIFNGFKFIIPSSFP